MSILGPNVDYTVATRRLRQYNLEMFAPLPTIPPAEKRTGRPRLLAIRENVFDDMADPIAAYWAGFIYADGCVVFKPRWALTVPLAARDSGHVIALAAFLGTEAHAVISARRGGFEGGDGLTVRLNVCSRRLVLALTRWGVVPRKTYEPCEPPVLSGQPRIAFLRGLFDGNGGLHVTKRGYLQAHFTGNRDVVEWFIAAIGVPHQGLKTREHCAYAQWTGAPAAKTIARLLYTSGPALARKAAIATSVQ